MRSNFLNLRSRQIVVNPDWDEDIMGRRFIFDNPMAQASCGCGTSFSIKFDEK